MAGAPMQLVLFKGEADSQTIVPSTLNTYEYDWAWRGTWLIRHHRIQEGRHTTRIGSAIEP
eukprot:8719097-Prorocentrum_lima.AAC.1